MEAKIWVLKTTYLQQYNIDNMTIQHYIDKCKDNAIIINTIQKANLFEDMKSIFDNRLDGAVCHGFQNEEH